MISPARTTALLLVAAAVMSAGACSNVLGITDVPDGAAPSPDASVDADFDAGDEGTDIDANDDDAGNKKDAGPQCLPAGGASEAFVGKSPPDPGGNCCTQFCIGNSVGTAGVCGETAGVYSVTYNGNSNTTFLGSFLDTSFTPASLLVQITFPGLDDPGHITSFEFDVGIEDTGCTTNRATFFYSDGNTILVYEDDGTTTCGLDVTSIPPDAISATFNGKLKDSDGDTVTLSVIVSQPYP